MESQNPWPLPLQLMVWYACFRWREPKYLGHSGEAKYHLLLQDECEGLLDRHYKLLVVDLTPPFVNDLACSGYPPGRYF